ncbi:hypothetical protein CAPTEDRAFT_198713 [Capitella teleta]|uniref:Pyrroline-5-carboxylate reductase catalytic N-terminal domain-containing protein n=1 Tax=Capitella teleta TaxID=283909 RepID=R7V236_CAPTE|nr:hypothetical protein CAPTEDRAFT_198713 [Capitella teleta]|eukprot:ELU12913.1 hypothetical protein CAPTEDRAFT_198713 [Capitella teleta]
MALIRHQGKPSVNKVTTNDDNFEDITENLATLQFESALTAEEKELLNLRPRSHALTAFACAQATYFVAVLSEARLIKSQLEKPKITRTNELLQESDTANTLVAGIIGCGRLGSHLAHCILSVGEVSPENIRISTRRPETLTELQEKGVICTDKNSVVAKSCDILFLCILPSQLPVLLLDIKGVIRRETLVYSFIPTYPLAKLSSLLGVLNVVHPKYHWTDDKYWDNSIDITATFKDNVLLEQMCPLSFNSKDCLIYTNETFAEQLIYAFVNMCSLMGVKCQDAIDIVNAIILDHSAKSPLTTKLELLDFTNQFSDKESVLPLFNLSSLEDRETPLTAKLRNNKYIRSRFVNKFCKVFQNYFEWKKISQFGGKILSHH